jgi:hypothetical protein
MTNTLTSEVIMTATATKTRKTRKTQRHAALSSMTNGKQCLWLTQDGKTRGYVLTALASEIGGAGYRLGKADNGDGSMEEYDVLLDHDHGFHTCECKGFLRHQHCKHVESLVALTNAGKLPKPATNPAFTDADMDFCNP